MGLAVLKNIKYISYNLQMQIIGTKHTFSLFIGNFRGCLLASAHWKCNMVEEIVVYMFWDCSLAVLFELHNFFNIVLGREIRIKHSNVIIIMILNLNSAGICPCLKTGANMTVCTSFFCEQSMYNMLCMVTGSIQSSIYVEFWIYSALSIAKYYFVLMKKYVISVLESWFEYMC